MVALLRPVVDRPRHGRAAGAETLGRVVQDARADGSELFDEHGQLLLAQHWPDTIANSVEAFEFKPDGGYRVRLVPSCRRGEFSLR